MEETSFFIRRRGRVSGPHSLRDIQRMKEQRTLSRFDDVSTDNINWQAAGELEILNPQPVAPKRPATPDVQLPNPSHDVPQEGTAGMQLPSDTQTAPPAIPLEDDGTIPVAPLDRPVAAQPQCPTCRQPVRINAAICIDCGHDFRTGQRTQTILQEPGPALAPSREPQLPGTPWRAPSYDSSAGGIFSMQGRLNRAAYVWPVVILSMLTSLAWCVIGIAYGVIGQNMQGTIEFFSDIFLQQNRDDPAHRIALLVSCVFVVIRAFFDVRRLHDLNRPSWHYWLLLIPFYGSPYLALVLLFKKGTAGPNDYGADPLG